MFILENPNELKSSIFIEYSCTGTSIFSMFNVYVIKSSFFFFFFNSEFIKL